MHLNQLLPTIKFNLCFVQFITGAAEQKNLQFNELLHVGI